jgi:hypothetical protein
MFDREAFNETRAVPDDSGKAFAGFRLAMANEVDPNGLRDG